MAEKEGEWAREYRQGRAEQVKQQRIANMIALSESPRLSSTKRSRLSAQAYRELFADPEPEEPKALARA